MSERDPERTDLAQLDSVDDGDVEILEIVGLDDEELPVAHEALSSEEDEDSDEIVLDLDDPPAGPRDGGPALEETSRAAVDRTEQLMRLQADFDNYKRRVDQEREVNQLRAAADLVTRLLPVLDNFERAVAALQDSQDGPAFREGVILTFRQLLEELRKDGLEAIDTVGETFDPHLHEAVATDTTSEFPPDTVVEELRRGYLLHDRLLRPALVKVRLDPRDVVQPSEEAN